MISECEIRLTIHPEGYVRASFEVTNQGNTVATRVLLRPAYARRLAAELLVLADDAEGNGLVEVA